MALVSFLKFSVLDPQRCSQPEKREISSEQISGMKRGRTWRRRRRRRRRKRRKRRRRKRRGEEAPGDCWRRGQRTSLKSVGRSKR